ncbi:oligosaccharide flippase family protein [Flavobacteriaceae bacterium]|nr:oligosaccharide flippase family protein [Flavobacteriaceae bacterium]MDB9955821.1 oligosaccharide flippase family protein [Flavobacteriaceae bacterium]
MINFLKNILNLDIHTKEVFFKSSTTIVVQIIGIIARLVTSIILGRFLGAAGLGEINLINQVITIIMVISMFGMDHVLVKKIAIGNSTKNNISIGNTIFTALLINISIAAILTILGVFSSGYIASFFNNPELQLPLIISFMLIVPQTIGGVFVAGINGYRKIWQSRLLKDFLTSLIVLIGIGCFFYTNIEITLISVIILYILGRLITFIVATLYWSKIYKPVFIKKFIDKSMLKMAVPLLFVSATTLLTSSVDIIMLGWLTDTSKVGLYTVAARLVLFVAFFLQITNAAISPKLATFFNNNQLKEINIMVQQVTFWLIIIGLISSLFFLIFGKSILGFWGDEFSSAYVCLMILCLGQFINISTGCSGVLLIMSGNEKIFSYISALFLVLNIVLNYFLITRYSEIGAAIATATTIIAENIIRVIVVKQKTGISTIPISVWRSN